jgi:hypothetical protein
MEKQEKPQLVIGRVEHIKLPSLHVADVAARVDTGAKTSALWASDIVEANGELSFCLFDKGSKHYTGERITTKQFSQIIVSNSTGHIEERYTFKTLVVLKGRKIHVTFTLANRSSQVYPVLLGRNILRGKFIVDVKLGKPQYAQERQREIQKLAALKSRKDQS